MTTYDQIQSGTANYFGEALAAAAWIDDATFEGYALSQGSADVWEALLPYAGERHAELMRRAIACFEA